LNSSAVGRSFLYFLFQEGAPPARPLAYCEIKYKSKRWKFCGLFQSQRIEGADLLSTLVDGALNQAISEHEGRALNACILTVPDAHKIFVMVGDANTPRSVDDDETVYRLKLSSGTVERTDLGKLRQIVESLMSRSDEEKGLNF
jgi:hypothetical protein